MRSSFFSLNWRDLGHGVFLAVVSAISTGLYQVIDGLTAIPPVYPTTHDLMITLKIGLGAGLGYMLKQLLSNTSGILFKKDA